MDSQTIQQSLGALKRALLLHVGQGKQLLLEELDASRLAQLEYLAALPLKGPQAPPAAKPRQQESRPLVAVSARAADSLPPAEEGSHETAPITRVEPVAPPSSLPEAPKRVLDPGLAPSLDSLHLRFRNCMDCALGEGRKSFVFGEGNGSAELMVIGEAPGEEEDRQARPFVGRSGQLVTQMITAMGISRESVYICNAVKCRPPGNRAPKKEEVAACRPLLERQIELLRPKVILTLGNVATHALLPTGEAIMKIRGSVQQYGKRLLIPTFHPSYLLRSPVHLKEAWEDMRKVRAKLFSTPQAQPREST